MKLRCASRQAKAAIGRDTDSPGNSIMFVVSESDGVWGASQGIRGPANLVDGFGDDAQISAPRRATAAQAVRTPRRHPGRRSSSTRLTVHGAPHSRSRQRQRGRRSDDRRGPIPGPGCSANSELTRPPLRETFGRAGALRPQRPARRPDQPVDVCLATGFSRRTRPITTNCVPRARLTVRHL
jgi:hypothetical protein